jgi:DNA polymerase-3 subunit alpha
VTGFVHLKLHSEFSLVDGLVRIKPLAKALVAQAVPAMAVTDEMNLFSAVKIQGAAESAGLKPIFGADVWVVPETDADQAGADVRPLPVTLLVQNLSGYRQLTRLISLAYLERIGHGKPCVTLSALLTHSEGLILLSGGQNGHLGQLLLSDAQAQAEAFWQQVSEVFEDRAYIEVARVGRTNEAYYVRQAVEFAARLGVPVVATNDVRFILPEDYEAHEVRVCIHQGVTFEDSRRSRDYTPEQYLKTPDEMMALFADLPQALENSVEIARRCNLEVPLGTYYLPNYPIPEGMTVDEFFRQKSAEGLKARLIVLEKWANQRKKPWDEQSYWDRLEEELDIIIKMGFPGYFLIVMDFILWAKDNGVPVGPGRGSGAGSLVAYALQITDLDPLEYDLLFERFLNPERVSMPDFDVDFCMDGRDRVIDYVAETYGRNAVSQIITFGSMAAKAVVRDVGRVQGKSYGYVDRIAKMIPFELGMTLTKALDEEEALRQQYDNDEEVKVLLDMALKLEGLTRNVGKHAGGVVIAPSALTDFVPLFCDETGANLVTQFDKDDVESAGLVKFDFLGLRTLTIVDWALSNIRGQLGESLDITQIPLDDQKTFAMMQTGKTTAVFQLESRGMQDLIKRLKPSCFEDIVALVALFRPGPLQSGMVDDFINRKHGRAEVDYPHPNLEPILSNTYGVILYQEQVMQIAQVLAGYTLGGADMLRRAMGKKKPEEMAKQREIFLEGALKNDVTEEQANYIFDLMEKFAGYGFNKSHSAAYALVSYQTAWLKTHYPPAFMAAVLSSDMDNTDKVVIFVEECRQMGLTLLPPDVNRSFYRFTVDEQGEVLYGLGAIKGVGEGPVEAIISARETGDAFTDLFDFCQRVGSKKLNKRTVEALIRAGAFDAMGQAREVLLANTEQALRHADQVSQRAQSGIGDLFGMLAAPVQDKPRYLPAEPMPEDVRLRGERDTLGLYLTGHPISQHRDFWDRITSARLNAVQPTRRGQCVTVAGLIVALRSMKNKRGERMAFLTIDDQTARLEVSVFSDLYDRAKTLLQKDEVVVVEGEVQHDDYSGQLKLVAQNALGLAQAQAQYARRLCLALSADVVTPELPGKLAQWLAPYRLQGGVPEGARSCQVVIGYANNQAKAKWEFGRDWRISLAPELIDHLREQLSDRSVTVEY